MSQLSQIFTNIANAIRSKTGSTNSMTPLEMPQAINEIPSGGGIITDAKLSVPVFLYSYDEYTTYLFLGYKSDGTLAQTVAEFPEVKWWMEQSSGRGSDKHCFTTSDDRLENAYFMQYDFDESLLDLYTTTQTSITINGSEVTIDGTTYNFTPATLPICVGFSMCTSS